MKRFEPRYSWTTISTTDHLTPNEVAVWTKRVLKTDGKLKELFNRSNLRGTLHKEDAVRLERVIKSCGLYEVEYNDNWESRYGYTRKRDMDKGLLEQAWKPCSRVPVHNGIPPETWLLGDDRCKWVVVLPDSSTIQWLNELANSVTV